MAVLEIVTYPHPVLKKPAETVGQIDDTIKQFVVGVLGVDEALADKDACEIEHVISDKTLDKLVEYLESMNP